MSPSGDVFITFEKEIQRHITEIQRLQSIIDAHHIDFKRIVETVNLALEIHDVALYGAALRDIRRISRRD